MRDKSPTLGHDALTKFQSELKRFGGSLTVVTQNIDELHQKASTADVIEMHGTLFKTRCTECGEVKRQSKFPFCPALEGRGAPDADAKMDRIPREELPRCEKCSGLLRPHVVWFGECLEEKILDNIDQLISECDMLLVVS